MVKTIYRGTLHTKYYGRAVGITKAQAEDAARFQYDIPKKVKLNLTILYKDSPFTIFDVSTETRKGGKK